MWKCPPPEPIPYPQDTSELAAPAVPAPSLPPPQAMSDGVSMFLCSFEQAFDMLIVQPVQDFYDTCVANQERLCILKAITPAALDHTASNIAEEINAERSVTLKTLRDVVCTKANNMNHGLSSKLTAL